MARPTVTPTGVERFWPENDVIVSKTDTKGIITYANEIFCDLAGFSEQELVGAPHNIIRHPDMPQSVFKLLWDTLGTGKEIFAYVVNMARNGDHYWVLAHVTPTFDSNRKIVGFHSNRRVPDRAPVELMEGLYKQLRDIESQHASPKDGMAAATAALMGILNDKGVGYDEFILSL